MRGYTRGLLTRAFSGLFPDELAHSFNLETEHDDLYNDPKPLCTRDHQPSSSIESESRLLASDPSREAAPCSTPATHLAPKAAVVPPGFILLILGLMVFMGP